MRWLIFRRSCRSLVPSDEERIGMFFGSPACEVVGGFGEAAGLLFVGPVLGRVQAKRQVKP